MTTANDLDLAAHQIEQECQRMSALVSLAPKLREAGNLVRLVEDAQRSAANVMAQRDAAATELETLRQSADEIQSEHARIIKAGKDEAGSIIKEATARAAEIAATSDRQNSELSAAHEAHSIKLRDLQAKIAEESARLAEVQAQLSAVKAKL